MSAAPIKAGILLRGLYVRIRFWRLRWAIVRHVRSVLWVLRGRPVPKAGALVTYGLNSFDTAFQSWRVSSWYKAAVAPDWEVEERQHGVRAVFPRILFESCQEIDGRRLVTCPPEEAEFVGLESVGGAIAPIGECKFMGYVQWPAAQLDEYHRDAVALCSRREMVF